VRALEALTIVRSQRLALSAAAAKAGTTVRTVLRYAGPAVQQLPSGRYLVKPHDRLYRRVQLIATTGPLWIDTRSSRTAQLASRHAHAVHEYGRTGDSSVFDPFRGRRVGGYVLATEPVLLAGLAAAGELDDFQLYESS
jgi:hypothetical protein